MVSLVMASDGAPELARRLSHAGEQLEDWKDVNRAVAGVISSAARAPRVSGFLAGSVREIGEPGAAIVEYTAPYAGVIHWGWPARGIKAQPWLSIAATGTESTWIDRYSKALDSIIDAVGD